MACYQGRQHVTPEFRNARYAIPVDDRGAAWVHNGQTTGEYGQVAEATADLYGCDFLFLIRFRPLPVDVASAHRSTVYERGAFRPPRPG